MGFALANSVCLLGGEGEGGNKLLAGKKLLPGWTLGEGVSCDSANPLFQTA